MISLCVTRFFASISFALLISLPMRGAAGETKPPFAALDLTIAETLIAMEYPPAAMFRRPPYSPGADSSLPPGAVQLGSTSQPNLELLAERHPTYIVITPALSRLVPRISRIAPVRVVRGVYRTNVASWQQMVDFTYDVGKAVGQEHRARSLVWDTERHFDGLRAELGDANLQPLLIIRLMDDRHARVYGANSIYQGALDRLGLHNAWTGSTSPSGFVLVGIDALIGIDARLVLIEPPFAESVFQTRYNLTGLWRYMASVRRGDVISIPYVFHHFGALPDSRRFADILVTALQARS